MRWTPMPELITGLTDLLILLSATCCWRGLRGRGGPGLGLWRGFFFLLGLAAALGAVLHCLDWGAAAELGLWLGFDLLMGGILVLLPLAAISQVKGGPPSLWLSLPLLALGSLAAWVMARSLFSSGFEAQFWTAFLATLIALGVYLACCLGRLLRDGDRKQCWALAGLIIVIASALPWVLGNRLFQLGPILADQVALLHLGLSLAAPMLYAAIDK